MAYISNIAMALSLNASRLVVTSVTAGSALITTQINMGVASAASPQVAATALVAQAQNPSSAFAVAMIANTATNSAVDTSFVPTMAVVFPCPNGCSGQGTCTAAGTCHCNMKRLGADCSIATNYVVSLAAFSLAFRTVGTAAYFQLSVPSMSRWVGFAIGAKSDGMTGGDYVVLLSSGNSWVLNDMYATSLSSPLQDTVQNFQNITVWMANGGLMASWSRALDTGDSQDNVITNSAMSMSWAVGPSGATAFVKHNTKDAGVLQVNFGAHGLVFFLLCFLLVLF